MFSGTDAFHTCAHLHTHTHRMSQFSTLTTTARRISSLGSGLKLEVEKIIFIRQLCMVFTELPSYDGRAQTVYT